MPANSAEILAHVNRLLASPDFRIPARRARLLRYLAEHAADGDAINEYAIGVDVFERAPSFDPRSDAVVRAEVRRLRRNLTEYYTSPGVTRNPILELPARSYVPILRTHQARSKSLDEPPKAAPRRRLRIWLAIGVSIALAVVLARPWFSRRVFAPPPFSLAVLPAVVAPSAADFAARADAFSQEFTSALWSTPGLSVLDWMRVSGFRGAAAVAEARSNLPAALILETGIERRQGDLQVQLRLFGRNSGRVLWSHLATVDSNHFEASAHALAAFYLSPFLEREYDIFSYRRATGRTRIQPVLSEPAPAPDPCAAKPPLFVGSGGAAAQVTIGAQALNATSADTRIEIFANGQRGYPSTIVHTVQGSPIALRAPGMADLAVDSCVLTGASGDAPLYGDRCVVAPAGVSHVWLQYTCAPKTRLVDITRLANDANLWNEETFPSGLRILAGVPFRIPDGINRFRDAGDDMRGARPVTLTIPVDQPGVSQVFFLLNTAWGQPGPASYLTFTFAGDRGARFEKKLMGGVDIRDYNRGVYTNTIDGVTSRPAFDNGRGQRMDAVAVDLPPAFRQQTLKTITMLDTGRWTFQRAILWAVSVR